jgi:PRC-barrel domain protein
MAELPNRQDFGDYGEWPGRAVLDSEGQGIGEVREIYLDQSTGRPEWVLVRTEGGDARFVPLAASRVEGESLRVAFARDRVIGAPDFGGDKRIDQDQERTLYDHYGVAYSESASDSGLPDPDAEVEAPAAGSPTDAEQAAAAGTAAGVPAAVADEEAGRAAEEDRTGSVQAPADASELTGAGAGAGLAAGAAAGMAGSSGADTSAEEETAADLDRAEAREGASELDRGDAREDLEAALSEDDAVALHAGPEDTAVPTPSATPAAAPTDAVTEPTWTPPSFEPGSGTDESPGGIKAAVGSRPVQLAGAGVGALLLLLLVRRLRS